MKRQLIAVLSILCGFSLQANAGDEFLYWMIGTGAKIIGNWGVETPVSGAQYYARVGYTESPKSVEQIMKAGKLDGYLNLYGDPSSSDVIVDLTGVESNISTKDNEGVYGVLGNPVYAKLQANSDFTYWVELLNATGEVAGYSSMGTYSTLSEHISTMELNPGKEFAASVFTVPEPNSALLLMIGCAALALRRRRKIAA